ncbi:putative alpha-2-macroglobulin-P-like, partial [Triplophysa rosa]
MAFLFVLHREILIILLLCICHGASKPVFMVTFPALIKSGLQARLCVSLLQPTESVQLTIDLVHNDQNQTLLQMKKKQDPQIRGHSFVIRSLSLKIRTHNSKTVPTVYKTVINFVFPPYDNASGTNYKTVATDLRMAYCNNIKLFLLSLQTRNGRLKNEQYPTFVVCWRQCCCGLKLSVCGDNYILYIQPRKKLRDHFKIIFCFSKFATQPCSGIGNKAPAAHFHREHFRCPYPIFSLCCQVGIQEILSFKCFINGLFPRYNVSLESSESVPISYSIGSITFLDEPEYFKNGRYIKGKVKVELFNGTPVSKSKVNFLVNSLILTPAYPVITDINGMADFTIDIPPVVKTSFTILASTTSENQFGPPFYFENVLKTLQLQEQPKAKKSQLTIKTLPEPLKCGVVTPVTVQYTVDGSVTIVYLILSRGEIIQQGYKRVTVTNSVLEGEVSFRVHIHPKMAPKMEFLAYCVLPSEIVLAASKTFQTEKCLINKVSAQFSPATAIPGEENTLQLSAQPGSLCGLTGVDQSVLIMEKNKRLNVDNVFSMLPDIFLPYDIEDPVECLNIRARRSRYSPILPYPSVPENTADSVYELFRNMGLKVATNLIVRIPPCVKLRDILYQRVYSVPGMVGQGLGGVGVGVGIGVPYAVPPIETIRTFFPETWIWDLVEVGDSGSTQVPVKVPDTITTWETEVFCLSSEGLGLAPPAQLTVFQPFFLELSLPYSIIRGEIFELKATVFNYLSKCIMVTITPAPSSDFTLKASSDDQYSSCLCANGRKTFKWILTPSVLGVLNITVSAEAEQSQTVCDNEIVSVPERGRIDTVTQSLHVNAEGVEKTQSHSWFLCPKGQKLIEEIELAFPKNVIEGSARSAVSVLGKKINYTQQN